VLSAWLNGEEYKPGGSGFMGRSWDAFVPSPVVWMECLRVLKPGGYLLAFAGTRTYDWIVMGVRLAGFEIRDMVGWVYSQGFPKSLDVSKAIDAMMGAEREVVGVANRTGKDVGTYGAMAGNNNITAPATEAARQWSGFGTALKPSIEPVVCARKPLDGTVAENVLKWGTGAINVDGCRVQTGEAIPSHHGTVNALLGGSRNEYVPGSAGTQFQTAGRWPANIIHDGSEEVLGVFPQSDGCPVGILNRGKTTGSGIGYGSGSVGAPAEVGYGDSGSASRFFYAAKASRTEREHGLDALPRGIVDPSRELDSAGRDNPRTGAGRSGEGRANIHPTVKPVDLMRYLTRLVTPPGGLVVDPYAGSGTTGVAAIHEGFRFMGAEQDTAHALIAVTRIEQAVADEHEARTLATMQIPLF
jgi:site-specific DNA-methyltransferase (adenine-specific)